MISSTTRPLCRFSSSEATSWLCVFASSDPRVPRRRVCFDSLMLRCYLGRAERRPTFVADVAGCAGEVIAALVTVRAVAGYGQIDNPLSAEKQVKPNGDPDDAIQETSPVGPRVTHAGAEHHVADPIGEGA